MTQNLFQSRLVLFILFFTWIATLIFVPIDEMQGEVYKILYLHVPQAFCALFVSAVMLFIFSIIQFLRPDDTNTAFGARAWAELGLIGTVLTLVTGSLWGYPTWGTWWTWDARLTTTLILAILYFAYLLLQESMMQGRNKNLISACLGVLIFIDVPIIYKSVTWWRTLHQPASIIESRGSTMDSEMLAFLVLNTLITVVVYFVLWRFRFLLLKRKNERGWA